MNFKHLIKYIPLLPVFAVLTVSVFSPSCANTTEAPKGGPKDTIPPVITKVIPHPGTVGVPLHGLQVAFTFNEYVTVKDAKAIYLSPPQSKSPKHRIKGKSVIVYFEEDLLPNTTYTLDISGAIADNNEGNLFPGFTTVFSTGDSIDSMFVCGTVRNCTDLKPIAGATVLLYKDPADSAVFLRRPFASSRTDEWGYFSVRNIPDTCYRIYAIADANGNNLYDPDEDRIAFLDTAFVPKRVVNDSLPELQKFDAKDTLNCLARENDFVLNVFREKPSKQMIMNSKRLSDRSCYITFMAPGAQIDSLWFQGYPATRVITEFNILEDSLLLWLNVQKRVPDTLNLMVRYQKTDSSGILRPFTETVKLYEEGKAASRTTRKQVSHGDTICPLKIVANPETVEQLGFAIEFDYPPILGYFDSLSLVSVNPRQQEAVEKFSIERDSLNLRRYLIKPDNKLMPGFDYKFKVPHRIFQDINGYWNDSTQTKVTLPNSENLSSLTLNLQGVNNKYIIDLLDEGRKNVLRSYTILSDASLTFPYLKAGKYSIRIAEDVNRNGIVDSGNLLQHKQPESVIFLNFKNAESITIPERSEILQEVDISTLF
ncbi:MAG: Ig-like domain-containing domain [Candidatus Cryptobacteroides sp.]